MTISSENVRNLYSGNDSTKVFAYSYKINDEAHLDVVIADADDSQTVLTITTHYTVSGVGVEGGGNVTLGDLTSICGQATLPTGWSLAITRDVPLTQTTDVNNQGGFYAATHEDAFDHGIMVSQQLQEQLDRCPKVTQTSGDTGAAYLTTIDAAVVAAQLAQTNAETAETNAETAETNAAASAAAASTSETNAGTSETNAAASAAAASTSETNASTSETNAGTSETNASASASSATTSASNASTSETNAAASAAAASTSETNSGTSETNAAASAAAASTSETNAATSETNAAASAASINLPTISGGDTGKVLRVNVAEDGHELTDVKITTTDIIDLPEKTTPSSPAANRRLVYPKADGGFYTLDSVGTESELIRNPMTTNGDIIARIAGVNARLGIGAINRVLASDGSLPTWAFPILDEDDLSSDSATSLVTQQSVKAYIDNQKVYATGYNTAGTSFPVSGTTYDIAWTETFDNKSAFDGTIFTAPADMILYVSGGIGYIDASANTVITAYDMIINVMDDVTQGVFQRYPMPSPADNSIMSAAISHAIYLQSGERCKIQGRVYFTGTGTAPSLYSSTRWNQIAFTGIYL